MINYKQFTNGITTLSILGVPFSNYFIISGTESSDPIITWTSGGDSMKIIGTVRKTGELATIVNFEVDGSSVYITYIDAANNLKAIRDYLPMDVVSGGIFGTNCSAVG